MSPQQKVYPEICSKSEAKSLAPYFNNDTFAILHCKNAHSIAKKGQWAAWLGKAYYTTLLALSMIAVVIFISTAVLILS